MGELEQFVILAKGQKGRAMEALIRQVMSNKKIYVFGDLLELPSVQGLSGGEYDKTLRTLELFAYGTFMDYSANRDVFVELSDAQVYKLKQLSVVTLAQENRVLSYTALMTSLSLPTVRALEELVVDAVYVGVLKARLNQKDGLVRVKDYVGRDVPPGEWEELRATLSAFQGKVSGLMGVFQKSARAVAAQRADDAASQAEVQAAVEKLKIEIKRDVELGNPNKPSGDKGRMLSGMV